MVLYLGRVTSKATKYCLFVDFQTPEEKRGRGIQSALSSITALRDLETLNQKEIKVSQ